MFDYSSEKMRRIQQFASVLQPMHHRTVHLEKDCCFLRIEERHDDQRSSPALEEARTRERVHASSISDSMDTSDESDVDIETWSDDGWRQDDQSKRYIQFVFLERHFEMDLPKPTLWPDEARKLLRERTGFFFLGDRPGAESLSADVKRFQPLRKAYVHGDIHSAAEDIAFTFFELWRFPIDARLYLTTFGRKHSWDSGKPLD